ncbi:MAG: ABC transporter ATP-binding protein [Chloroflexota bacterium]|nr:ABC transporter ATP-binding protein [Chloroflexota bacterium]
MDLRYERVTKKFGSVVALDDFNLHIEDGEFMVMLGPSGCGKTTALRCLAGLEKPTSGIIRIGERIVNNLEPRDRDISLVFQSYALYPHLTVGENIMYPLRIRKVPKAERQQMAQEVADRLQIGELLNRRPRELSGGQRQRVALARAIVRDPVAFLMDEPLSNLDAKLRVHMRAELKHLQKSLGTTTLYVTHDQTEAMTMADRVAVLRDGLLQQVGTINDIYYRPVNLFVATFVGSPAMNVIPIQYDPGARQFVMPTDFAYEARPLLDRFAVDGGQAGRYLLGVRSENISISLEETPSGVPSSIYALEPMGNEVLVAVDVGELRLIIRAEPMFQAAIRERCWLDFDQRLVHLFDEKSEQRLAES